jgi:hypothetical protein
MSMHLQLMMMTMIRMMTVGILGKYKFSSKQFHQHFRKAKFGPHNTTCIQSVYSPLHLSEPFVECFLYFI